MKIGETIRIVQIPKELPDDDMHTRLVFERCLNRLFPIVGLQNGLLELEVGEVMREAAYMHSIWIEPACVELVDDSDSPISPSRFIP
jgi:hypothetical protein